MSKNQLTYTLRSGARWAASVLLVALLAGCGGDKPDAMLASARDYLGKNDPKAAIIQLKNALQKNPELAEARFLLGQALLRTGDAQGSEAELRKALALKHPAEQVVPVLVQAMSRLGQFKKVTDEFATTEFSPPAAQASFKTSLALAFAAQGKGDLAQLALKSALTADPKHVPALIQVARDKAGKGDFDAALADVDAILATSPASHDAWKLKGDIHVFGTRKEDAALEAYRKSIEVKPDFIEGHLAIITSLLRGARVDDAAKQLEVLKKLAPNSVQTRFYETMVAYQKKDFKQAREVSLQLIKVMPNNAMALQLAGAIELEFNSLLQAESYLSKAVQLAPETFLARRLLTTVYLRSGQPSKAVASLQPLLKSDKVDAPTLALAGEVYLQNNDAAKAEEYFSRANKLDPKNAKTRTALALTHMASGREDSGFAELQDIAASDTGVTANLALISAHLRRKELDQALKAIDALEKKQPDKPLAANLRGRTLLAKKDTAGARKSFEQSVQLDPTYFPSVASLAAMDLADKKPEEARKRFDAVLVKDPKNGQALLALAELRARSGGSKEEIAELINRAVTANPTEKGPRLLLVDFHLRNKDSKLALSAAQNAVAAVPDSPELLDALGRAQQASGDTNQALASFGKVAAMQPLSPVPQLRLAEAHVAAKDTNAAIQSLRKALEIKPDLLEAQSGLVRLSMLSKTYEEAVRVSRTVQKQRPKEAVGYLMEGDVAASQGKWDLAAEAYRGGLKQATTSSSLAVKYHRVLGAANKVADVEKFTAAWLKDNPKDADFRMYLGDYSSTRADYPSAEKYYQNVLQLQPGSAVVLNNLAWATGKLNKEGAVAYAERALAIAPNQPAFMDTLAMLLSSKGDHAKALEWQNKAVALQPQAAALRLNLAKIQISAGKKDLARKELDELVKLGDKFPAQAEVAKLLKSL